VPPDQTPERQREGDLHSPPRLLPFGFQSGLGGEGDEMGKNQAYKAMQRSRLGSSAGAPGAADAPEDGMVGPLPPPFHPSPLADL